MLCRFKKANSVFMIRKTKERLKTNSVLCSGIQKVADVVRSNRWQMVSVGSLSSFSVWVQHQTCPPAIERHHSVHKYVLDGFFSMCLSASCGWAVCVLMPTDKVTRILLNESITAPRETLRSQFASNSENS